jgi:hypothetical protein
VRSLLLAELAEVWLTAMLVQRRGLLQLLVTCEITDISQKVSASQLHSYVFFTHKKGRKEISR